MSKRALLRLASSICFMLCVIFLGQLTVFADEVNPEYDNVNMGWTTLAPMSESRSYFQTEVINGKIYAIGGSNDNKPLSSAEVYDPTTNSWTRLTPMSEKRKNFQTEVINGKIYAIGGNNGNENISSAEVYDPTAKRWTSLSGLSAPRGEFQTKVIDGKIYAIGGYVSIPEVYDQTTNSWTRLAPMVAQRYLFQKEVIDGKLYVIGGVSNNKWLKTTEVYDPTTNAWTTLAPMVAERRFFQTEVIDGKIYAIGGNNSSLEVYTINNSLENQLSATGGNSKVDLTWDAVDKATSYTIKRSTTAGGPYTTIATGVTETTYTDTNVTNGTTYYYVVTAIVNGSESWSSNEASATPQASTDPNQPTGNKALLVLSMVTGERKEYEMTTDKINDFIAWYNSKAASSPTYVIEKAYNKASFTARKDYIAYEQISNFEVNEYNN